MKFKTLQTGKHYYKNQLNLYSLDEQTNSWLSELFSKTALSWKQSAQLNYLLQQLKETNP